MASNPSFPPALHIVLVEPEQPGNVGSIARALANMGVSGRWIAAVEDPCRFEQLRHKDAKKMAVHAGDRLERLERVPSLASLVETAADRALFLGLTSKTGSPSRPHPLSVVDAAHRLGEKLRDGTAEEAYLVFGRESDGLTNDEVRRCDWVVTIPTDSAYDSLNLAQAVLLVCWEFRRAEWLRARKAAEPSSAETPRPGQRERLIDNVLSLAEECGFVLPGDPHKMRPKLERIFGQLPPHIEEARTLHGFLDQVRRSLRKGAIDWKGRYRHEVFGGGQSDGIGPRE
jgi:TrmH family RNA methyltransferase